MQAQIQSKIGHLSSRDYNAPLQWVRKPENQFNKEGGYALFAVAVTGRGCIRYKWYNPLGELIKGEISPFLEILSVSPASFGEYRVEVRNNLGEQLTAEAGLWKEKRFIQFPYKPADREEPYNELPTFQLIRQPVGITAALEQRAELSVTVEGVAPKFQWYYMVEDNDRPIHGQTGPRLIIEELQTFNYGVFYVEARDLFGQKLYSIPAEIKATA